MATTSFSESFKYGIRLFGLFVLIVLFGGGALAGGAALAVPEILAWRATGAVETPYIAGGLILALLGFSILLSGQFGLIYKLIADGVSHGNADPAVDLAAGPAQSEDDATEADEQGDNAPAAEQPVAADAPEQPAETEPPQGPEPPAESQPAQQAEPPAEHGQAQQTPTGAQPQDQQPAQASQQQPQDQQPAQPPQQQPEGEANSEGGREQTAEEIVFGTAESTDEEPPAEDGEESTGGFEFDDEPEEQAREDIETAGNPSSDPLADNFDDE